MENVKNDSLLGKIFYGSLFIFLLPIALFLWAKNTHHLITLSVPNCEVISLTILLFGFIFLLLGMFNLWSIGKGLPMNAYPPKFFVTRGAYAISSHPIYLGTILMSFGISSYFQSPSGFWLISPLFLLMIIAYVVGFENERIFIQFGSQISSPFLSVPSSDELPISSKARLATYFTVFLPWLLIYEAFVYIGNPIDSIPTNIFLDDYIPVLPFSIIPYSSVYLLATLVPLVLTTNKQLRSFHFDIWWAMIIVFGFYLCFPMVVIQKAVSNNSLWERLIIIDRSMDSTSAALPSFHVVWAFISARYLHFVYKRMAFLFYSIAVIISVSCLTTGNHSILDVIVGLFVFIIIYQKEKIWQGIKEAAEYVANSWREWHFGSVRIINHGVYAGLAAFAGTYVISSLIPKHSFFITILIILCAVFGAALWAQIIEGSPKLQRPYGYYGSVIGVLIGGVIISILFNISIFFLLGALSMAAPWIQMIGRFRCLVQGCCHGKPTTLHLGICFYHPLSRVNKISELKGVYLYPTQLYSMGTNFITGLILLRVYSLQMPAEFVIGLYLILNGIARFVEEYYRGETQTSYWRGMRFYQWLAMASIIFGAVITCINSSVKLSFYGTKASILSAIVAAIIVTIAYGVDFPNSNRRFARLVSS